MESGHEWAACVDCGGVFVRDCVLSEGVYACAVECSECFFVDKVCFEVCFSEVVERDVECCRVCGECLREAVVVDAIYGCCFGRVYS